MRGRNVVQKAESGKSWEETGRTHERWRGKALARVKHATLASDCSLRLRLLLLAHEATQHRQQNASLAVVFDVDRAIEASNRREVEGRAILAGNVDRDLLMRLEFAIDALDVERLTTRQSRATRGSHPA